jgi:hypothetical protein
MNVILDLGFMFYMRGIETCKLGFANTDCILRGRVFFGLYSGVYLVSTSFDTWTCSTLHSIRV